MEFPVGLFGELMKTTPGFSLRYAAIVAGTS
jgi:hypothetical protein